MRQHDYNEGEVNMNYQEQIWREALYRELIGFLTEAIRQWRQLETDGDVLMYEIETFMDQMGFDE